MAASIEAGGVCLWQAAHAPAETEWPSNLQGGPKKWDHRLTTTILSNLNRL